LQDEDPDLDFAAPEPIPEPPRRRTWREMLLSDNELDRYDGLLAVLGKDQAELLQTLPGLDAAERNRLLAALWQQADLLLLEGRDKARPIFAAACSLTPDPALRELWLQLVAFFRPAAPGAPFDPGRVALALESAPAAGRLPLARALLIHPNAEVRALARSAVGLADCWQVIANPDSSLRVLLEIWQFFRGKASDDSFKLFLTVIGPRFRGQLPREQLGVLSRLVTAIFEVGAFQERASRQMVLAIESHVRAQALRHGIDLAQDPAYWHQVQAYTEAPPAADQPIVSFGQLPLPLQRTLARRGLFLRHFSCHPVDGVAAECFPHLVRHREVIEFLKAPSINTRLMAQLAEEKQLYESDAAKFFLIANPRCPYHIISKYLGYLSSESLAKLSQGYLYGSFARKAAERLLEQRGKSKNPAPAKFGKRRPT
jgi:hypothetical protein